jgi:DNA-binding NtrC family response regulator
MADNPPTDTATLPETAAAPVSSLLHRESPGFIVIWAPGYPDLVGAWLPASAEPRILGRGEALESDPHPRVQPSRQLPGQNVALEPFASPALSRVQLELTQVELFRVKLKNLGRCPLSVNESPAREAVLELGDVAQIGNQLLLLCSRRPLRLAGEPNNEHRFGQPDAHGFVGESPAIWHLRRELAFVGARAGHALVHGESGTGKELAATALHHESKRRGLLVSRNAATFPETLIDAELFGNAKGYPNPGMPERAGLVGAADNGTLFLDEFAELPLAQQTRLLRVLDEGEYQRLGESAMRRVDVRVVGATNRPLSDLRQDVAARFAFIVNTPNLAARVEDVPLLVAHILAQVTRDDPQLYARFVRPTGEASVSAGLMTRLVRTLDAGNIRYLRNTLWRSLAESTSDTLTWPKSLVREAEAKAKAAREAPAAAASERERIRDALDRNDGSLDKTWRELGLSSRFALNRLMKKYGISLRRSSS